MAYSKVVIWDSPYLEQKLPYGYYGVRYTKVMVDIPLYENSRSIWTENSAFPDMGTQQGQLLEFETSLKYQHGTLVVWSNGEKCTTVTENNRNASRKFTIHPSDVIGYNIYCEYLPQNIDDALGDNSAALEKLYNVVAVVHSSTKLRDYIHMTRQYINILSTALNIEPPSWYGGKENSDIGEAMTLVPNVTPTSISLHLETIYNKVLEFISILKSLGYRNFTTPSTPEYTYEFIESIQKSLIEIDTAVEQYKAGV